MKASTKYAGIVALGAVGCLGGLASLFYKAYESGTAKTEIQGAENRKEDLASKLVDCVEISIDDCRAFSSQYKRASEMVQALENKYRERFGVPWLPLILMPGGYLLAFFGTEKYREKKDKEYREDQDKAIKQWETKHGTSKR